MRILVADDDPIIRKQLEIALSKHGYKTLNCINGTEAWKIIQSDKCPDIMILDWNMPGIGGLELCEKVKLLNREPQPYVLLLTAKDETKDVIKGLDSGADDYVRKPFFPEELRARLKVGVRSIDLQRELLKVRNQLKIEATHDYLTGILNRRAIMDSLQLELERGQRIMQPIGVVLFDLDFFKSVNDNYGHPVGDEILRETAKRVNSVLRPYDSLGRYGGEEFLLIFTNCGPVEAYALCERIRRMICDNDMKTESGSISISISIGLCVQSGPKTLPSEQLVKLADDALYKAKDSGRNRVEMVKSDI